MVSGFVIPSRVTRVLVDTQIPWMLMRSILSRLAKEKGHRVRVMGVSCAVEHIFNETAMHARAQASNRLAHANKASHGPRVRAEVRTKNTREKPKDPKMRAKVPKAFSRATHRKLVSQVLKTRNQRQAPKQESAQTCTTDTHWNEGWIGEEWNDGWTFDVWNHDWSSVGWHEGWEQTHDTSESSYSLGGLDVRATSSPKQSEWVKMNLDTRAAVNTFPLNFGPDGSGDGRFYRTASGEWVPDGGAWKFQGYNENGLLRSLNGRLIGVHKALCSVGEIACKGRQDFHLGHDGGYVIPMYSSRNW